MTSRSSWLHRDASVADALERRAARAALLAKDSINAAPLEFAAGLYRAQAKVAVALAARGTPSGSLERDLDGFLRELDVIARYARDSGPPGLQAEAEVFRKERRDGAIETRAERLLAWWRGPRTGRTDYLARALLRPYAETLAAAGVAPEAANGPAVYGACRSCGGPPWIAWRRSGSGSGDEAPQRLLGCGICGAERHLDRIACAGCGQTEPTKLAVFQTERHPAVRIEACDACQRYVKAIDMTLDGRVIPEVDDLCSLSLDLWAAEQGYERLEPSLAGV
jgi:formate dehydrogenase maturation protein FdhE